MSNTKNKLALFDFDGTITDKDSFIEFLKFAAGKPRYYLGFTLMGPFLGAFMAGLYPDYKMKNMVMSYFFKNRDQKEFLQMAQRYAETQLPGMVKASAMERLQWHRDQGHDIAVVSASFEAWLAPWCKDQNLTLISTKLEVNENRLTGKIDGLNCKGPEKVRRVKECYDIKNYSTIYAYGDSSGDKELLEMADEPFYRSFQ